MRCEPCDGTGRLTTWATDGRELYESGWVPCEDCDGTGEAICAVCYEEPASSRNEEGWPVCADCVAWARSVADTEPAPNTPRETP
jgi:hypothetical protein